MSVEKEVEEVISLLEDINNDTSIPRNIRRSTTEALEQILKEGTPMDVKAASAIFILDDVVNDPNIPLHARTMIYTIIGKLETISKESSQK